MMEISPLFHSTRPEGPLLPQEEAAFSLLEELGFVNDAAAYTGWLYDRANVAALEPDVIFADVSISVDEVKKSVIYAPVAAVKNDKVTNVDFTVFERQSPRMFEALREMGRFGYE